MSRNVDYAKLVREHPLATKPGLEFLMAVLFHTGALCPKCGFGTRVTSKRWCRCKKCGERVERRELPKP
jgi:tRNA(Ile2) C34 agmatinyltransferase TiaS